MTFYLPNRSCPCVPSTHPAAHVGRLGRGAPEPPSPSHTTHHVLLPAIPASLSRFAAPAVEQATLMSHLLYGNGLLTEPLPQALLAFLIYCPLYNPWSF